MLLPTILVLTLSTGLTADEISWKRVELDSAFRSEGVTTADVNRDGLIDVLAGEVWYAAPDWKMHEITQPGEYVAGVGYSESFADFSYDVNQDGWEDYILVGFPGKEFYWYENPQNKEGHWAKHEIWHSGCNESPDFEDVTGDGIPELIIGSQPESQFGYLEIPSKEKATEKWVFTPVSRPGDPGTNGSHRFYHGNGHGDLNQDGLTDLLIPHGWYEHPAAGSTEWVFHPYTLGKPGDANPLPAANLYVQDLDMDGDQDIVMSCAHAYGVWWFENMGAENNDQFEYHLIDESYSQTHALEFYDINGDGQKDFITGKRFFAHNGHDPGGNDEVVMYWYEIKRAKGAAPEFIPHEIIAGRDTGVGTQFQVRDFNGDGLYDIILGNKKGVNLLLQERH
ncbi:MAG: VCBS repeat-containing protein [Planctomycetaceae bacterium]